MPEQWDRLIYESDRLKKQITGTVDELEKIYPNPAGGSYLKFLKGHSVRRFGYLWDNVKELIREITRCPVPMQIRVKGGFLFFGKSKKTYVLDGAKLKRLKESLEYVVRINGILARANEGA